MKYILHPLRQSNIAKKCILLLEILVVQTISNVGANVQNRNALICNHNKTEQISTVAPFIEYFMEHQVTEKEARDTMTLLSRDDKEFYNKKPMSWCDPCTDRIRNYCLGPTFLKDHCCCDFRHETETLPFIPHSCYAAEDQCRPSSIVQSSCATYEEIRQCCCDQILKKTYNAMYSSSTSKLQWNKFYLLLMLLSIKFMDERL